jgi:hypothetical protein
MFGSTVLEIAIGLTLVYLLLSLICSAINEWIASLLALRANTLLEGIKNLLDDPERARTLYEHPLIDAFARSARFRAIAKKDGKPAYIASDLFARALLDILSISPAASTSSSPPPVSSGVVTPTTSAPVPTLQETLAALPDSELKEALLALARDVGNDVVAFRLNVEAWYNHAMDRVSGWYKRKVQVILIILGLLLSALLNVDTIVIGDALLENTAMREALVAVAEETASQPLPPSGDDPSARVAEVRQQIETLQLPIGWAGVTRPQGIAEWFQKVAGILVTGVAVSLGAPFWFDVLSKLVNVRASGEKPKERPKKTTPAVVAP